jgi:lipopolysaccharide transport system permease protein
VVAGRLLHYPVGGPGAIVLPAIVLLHLLMVSGLALGASALTVHFKDVRDLLANLLTLLFFLTPVLYPLDSIRHIPLVWWVVRLNPFTPFILAYQQALFYGTFPDAMLWTQMALVALAFWVFGAGLFERLRETLVEAA